MTAQIPEKKAIRLHLTNVAGLGAVQLLQSLLPAFEQLSAYQVAEMYLPTRGELAEYHAADSHTKSHYYTRYLPNALSRLLECTVFAGQFNGTTPLLVLGDIPLRCSATQTVFVQTTLLTHGANANSLLDAPKYWIARGLFRLNINHVANFIVQTETMKTALIKSYPSIAGRVHVITPPVPNWLLESQLKRTQRNVRAESGLRLFYPAAVYPHKNHRLLSAIHAEDAPAWSVSELLLTIPENAHPNPAISWIQCVDRLMPDAVITAYANADALLFLSLSESFGFPLVETMWIGLPIICPNLPYAHALCGEQAIYFNPDDVQSLFMAVVELNIRLASDWWPDWSENLTVIPHNWHDVAETMLSLATSEGETK
ncbi:MAG: glycosyltransferase [Methylococcales bacterium]|nr:glycosyltransferase [Methylococcales bacterium]